MTINEAQEVMHKYGFFLEHVNPSISKIFLTDMPESLLPYKKETILESLDIMEKEFTEQNNNQAVESIRGVRVLLSMYVDDHTALDGLNNKLNMPEFKKAILRSFKAKS